MFVIKNKLVLLLCIPVFLYIGCSNGSSDDTKETPSSVVLDSQQRADKGGSGVMLQGFTWTSPDDDGTWYTTISNNANDIKDIFEYVWFPPSTDSTDSNGYLPRQLNLLTQAYTKNGTHSPTGGYSKFYGTEEQLKKSIQDIKPARAIADVVINHRCGTTDWGDFTNPSWGVIKGKNYSAICSDDEGFNYAKTDMYGAWYKGAPDTGDKYDAARDIDHTNETVQDGIITWMNDVLKNAGFVGWRYDMVKGYDGIYNGYYNAKTLPEFSVGEYYDGSYDKISSWLERTVQYNRGVAGRPARAFDFVLKFSLNNVFGGKKGTENKNYKQLADSSNLYKKLPGYAVTFVENHDTGSYQNQNPLDSDDIGAAYAFILTHPGYPSVAWFHYFSAEDCPNDSYSKQYMGNEIVPGTSLTYKEFIKKLVTLRKDCGINDMSSVNVLRAENFGYAAEIKGEKKNLIVSLGSEYEKPNGYESIIKGTGFEVFSN